MRGNLAFIYVQTRRFDEALAAGLPAYHFFRAVGDPYFAAAAGANLAEASFELGRLDDAARYAGEVLALGDRHAAPYARFTLGQVARARRDPAASREFAASVQLAQANDDPYMAAYAQRAFGEALIAEGQPDAGRDEVQGALAIFRQLGMSGEIAATESVLAARSA